MRPVGNSSRAFAPGQIAAALLRSFVVVMVMAAGLAVPGAARAAVPFPEVPLDGWDTNGKVFAVKVVGSTAFIGGSFTTVRAPDGSSTQPRENLAAIDVVTGDVLPFVADTNSTVRSLESDGSTLWVGGTFSMIGGENRSGLAAVDAATGVVDSQFHVSNNGAVHGLALGNGRLYASGYFTLIDGVSQVRVASLDPGTGVPDAGFQANANESVRQIVVADRTGQLFAAGFFTSIGSQDVSYLAELDPDTGLVVGPGFEYVDAPLLDASVSPDGSMVFGAVAGFQNRAQAWNTFNGERRWYHRAMGDVQAVEYHDGNLFFGFHEGFDEDLTVRLLAVDVLSGQLQQFRPSMDSFFGVWAIDANSTALVAGGEFTLVSEVPTKAIAMFPGDGSPPDTTAPSQPAGLVDVAQSGEQVDLIWNPATDDRGVSHYRVYRDGQFIGGTAVAQYIDNTVAPDTEYSYRVEALDLAGNSSALSDPAVVQTWVNLVSSGDDWRYLDVAQSSSGWSQPGHNDSSWDLGPAQLGFGEGDEATTLPAGELTYYFRKTVSVPPSRIPTAAHLELIRDDGAVVYVNGVEALRTNMPAGTITSNTQAAETTAGADESRWFEFEIDPALFVPGSNVVAVEVHQRSLGSSDVSFDLRLDVALVDHFADVTPPTRPIQLTSETRTSTRIMLTWQAASDDVGVAEYLIYRDNVEIASTTKLWFRDQNLFPETEYTYKVFAVDAAGNVSPRSRIQRSTTFADELRPFRVQNLSVAAATPTSITLDWDSGGDNVAVSHFVVKSYGVRLGTTEDTTFLVEGLEPETLYHFAVRAVDIFDNYGAKRHIWYTTPAVVTTFDAVTTGSTWRFQDDGSDQGTVWRQPTFDDASWDSGVGEFGYGDGDETTVLASGPGGDHHITTYFRTDFELPAGINVTDLELGLVRDDGVVVYLNGVEVFRDNMPAGGVDSETLATEGISGLAESEWLFASVPFDALVTGTNVIAVEVHQIHRTSSDLSFHLTLTANP